MPTEADTDDIPSPIDWNDRVQVHEWFWNTVHNRPYRINFFVAFAAALNARFSDPFKVLELGSGPGQLAAYIIGRCPVSRYTALDVSPVMHDYAREATAYVMNRMRFVTRDFRDPDWTKGLGPFDAIVTMQAAHETRHKKHLVPLLSEARTLLSDNGLLLYCDHYNEAGTGKNPAMYYDRDDQPNALREAGFKNVRLAHEEHGMALYAAEK